MSRLFGSLCNQPERLVEALEPVRAALVTAGPVSRWGVGYVQGGEVLLSRHPRPAPDGYDLYTALDGLKSDYVVVYAAGEDGWSGHANTQPHRFRRWLIAQEIWVDDFTALRDDLCDQIPTFLRHNLKGRAPAEVLSHLFLALLHDAAQIDDINLDPHHIRRALRDASALVLSRAARLGVQVTLGNAIATNSRSMVAVRLGVPLFVRRLRHRHDPRLPDTEFKAVLVVDGQDNPGEGFEELPSGASLIINRDVSTDIADLEG